MDLVFFNYLLNQISFFNILSLQKALVITTNYFDFEYYEPDLTLFDVKKCFTSTDQHTFQVTFPGIYLLNIKSHYIHLLLKGHCMTLNYRKWITFQLFDFCFNSPGKFHPYLDIYQKVFQLETLEMMSKATGASILRFQELSLNYDPYNVYISATILGRPPFLSMN